MSHKLLLDVNFHSLLIKLDQELATGVVQKGCCHCGGQLHRSDYPRSPLGLPAQVRDSYESRMSWCCGNCRKRTTPASVRFFGRRWYPGPLLVLISSLTLGINERRCRQLKHHFGVMVSQTTWKRWRRWWQAEFIKPLSGSNPKGC